MAKRREIAEFGMSFLDVICCGFGAIILLLMITKTVQPQIIEASTINLEGKVAALQEQLFEIRGETTILNRDLNAKHEQLSEYEERIAILRGQLASVKSRHDSLNVQTNSNDIVMEQLAIARQSLSEEMRRLREKMQVIFQDPVASMNPRMLVGEIIEEGIKALHPDICRADRQQRILRLLQQVELDPAMLLSLIAMPTEQQSR